jgi:hypothetical protein
MWTCYSLLWVGDLWNRRARDTGWTDMDCESGRTRTKYESKAKAPAAPLTAVVAFTVASEAASSTTIGPLPGFG